MSELDIIVKELETQLKETFSVYQRTLPQMTSKLVASGFESYEDAMLIVKANKKRIGEFTDKSGDKYIMFYEVVSSKTDTGIYYNDPIRTTVGNDRKAIAGNYFDI